MVISLVIDALTTYNSLSVPSHSWIKRSIHPASHEEG
jgi:hypothetical protein